MGLSELVRFLQTHSLELVQFALTGSCSMDGEIDWLSTSSSITDFTNHCHCCRKTWQMQSCVCNHDTVFTERESCYGGGCAGRCRELCAESGFEERGG